MENKEVLLRVRNAKTYFPIRKGIIKRTAALHNNMERDFSNT